MTTSLNALVAREHTADLGRQAKLYRSAKPEATNAPRLIALRHAQAGDAQALKILAELDEEPELSGETLVALIDGDAVAAMSLQDGRVVSNPFMATREAVSLLKLRAHHLVGSKVRQPRRRWRARVA
jgi:streptomycin 6-kinase